MTDIYDATVQQDFNDPIVRCDGCEKLVHRLWIGANGGCSHCGHRKFRSVMIITDEEEPRLLDGSYDFKVEKELWFPLDPNYMATFEHKGVVKEVPNGKKD